MHAKPLLIGLLAIYLIAFLVARMGEASLFVLLGGLALGYRVKDPRRPGSQGGSKGGRI